MAACPRKAIIQRPSVTRSHIPWANFAFSLINTLLNILSISLRWIENKRLVDGGGDVIMLDIAHTLIWKDKSHPRRHLAKKNASAGAIETSDLTLGKWLSWTLMSNNQIIADWLLVIAIICFNKWNGLFPISIRILTKSWYWKLYYDPLLKLS